MKNLYSSDVMIIYSITLIMILLRVITTTFLPKYVISQILTNVNIYSHFIFIKTMK